jgi:N-acetyl sugar amidotransferase
MQYCKRCVYPANHPLGITFDKEGICSGCRVHEEKYDAIDWESKALEFEKIVSSYRGKFNKSYDCVIPVTGIGDDFYVVDLVKNKYKLNPLLVTYNTQFSTRVGIRNLARLVSELDCDHIHSTVGPDTVKKITRESIRLIGDMYWHVLAGSQTFPVQVATKFSIPLIIWGCHGWMDQVGQFSHFDMVEMTKKVRKEHGLRMMDAEDLLEMSDKLSFEELLPYYYPSDDQLEKSRVRGLYLNNFFFWNSKKQTEWAIEHHGYETIPQERTYNTHESIHCHNNAHVHDYVKYLKWGYSKVSDHAARDIRLKRMTRTEAISQIKKYEQVVPSGLGKFLEWIEMDEKEFFENIDKFRDEKIWKKDSNGNWTKIDSIQNHLDEDSNFFSTEKRESNNYQVTDLLENEKTEYILTGRHYMDEKNYRAES